MPEGLDAVIERAVVEGPGRALPERRGADRRRPRAPGRRRWRRRGCSRIPARHRVRRAGPRERATVPIGGYGDEPGGGAARGCRAARRSPSAPPAWPLIAAMVVLVLALVGGGDGVHASKPIPIGGAPLRIAADDDAIWVTSQPDGTLTRLNPESGARRSASRSSSAPASPGSRSAPARSGSPTRRAARSCGSTPQSGEVLKRIAVGGSPGAIAFGGGDVWVADEDGAGVSAVAAKSGRVLRRGLPPHAEPLRLAVGAGGLWVSSATTGSVRRDRPQHLPHRLPDPGRPRPRRRHRRPRPRLGRQQPLQHRDQGRPLDPRRARRPDRSRRPARAGSTPATPPSGSPAPPRTRSPGSTSRAASAAAPRSRSAPNPAPSRSATPRSGSPTTAKAPSPASNPE